MSRFRRFGDVAWEAVAVTVGVAGVVYWGDLGWVSRILTVICLLDVVVVVCLGVRIWYWRARREAAAAEGRRLDEQLLVLGRQSRATGRLIPVIAEQMDAVDETAADPGVPDDR